VYPTGVHFLIDHPHFRKDPAWCEDGAAEAKIDVCLRDQTEVFQSLKRAKALADSLHAIQMRRQSTPNGSANLEHSNTEGFAPCAPALMDSREGAGARRPSEIFPSSLLATSSTPPSNGNPASAVSHIMALYR